MNDDVRDTGADVYERLCLLRKPEVAGLGERAQYRERRQVDDRGLKPRTGDRSHGAVDHVSASRNQQNALQTSASVRHNLLERMDVEDCLVDWNRDDILDVEGQRLAQLGQRQ